ncbi:helix-turn-helix transcriptional regulator [Streptomyces sp. NPDC051180]|uniref:helix-turn-helix domain-containing protein n=1 Tax=unclassified Streptomyces TaxID=2593676 RepID=UPI00344F4C23
MATEHGTRCAVGEQDPWDRLAREMRQIKETSELSYAGLAQRTHYSRSSWERFLNRKQLPTRLVIEQFAHAAGQDPRPLLEQLDRCLRHAGNDRSCASVTGAAREPAVRTAPPGRLAPADVRTLALVSAAGMVVGGVLTAAMARAGGRRRAA